MYRQWEQINAIKMVPLAKDLLIIGLPVQKVAGDCIVEVTAVDPLGKASMAVPVLYNDKFIPGFKSLIDEVHKHGTKIGIQLHHGGRETLSVYIGGKQVVAPSPIPCPVCRETPRNLAQKRYINL